MKKKSKFKFKITDNYCVLLYNLFDYLNLTSLNISNYNLEEFIFSTLQLLPTKLGIGMSKAVSLLIQIMLGLDTETVLPMQ